MSIIKLPESVTNITHNTLMGSKSVEVTDLESHVAICTLRYEALEGRIDRIENKVNEMILQSSANNKLVIRTLLTIAGGTVTTFLVTHFKFI